MINRELIRLKVVQLVYAYYQNGGKPIDVAEKELAFSLQKSYELYEYLLTVLIGLKRHAERRDAVRLAREQRTGSVTPGISPDRQFANNKFLQQLAVNETLAEYQEKVKGQWTEEPAFLRRLYEKCTDNDAYRLYINKGDFSYEADREIVRKLYKNYICANEDFESLIEDHSLYWNDDKMVVDSFVLKTIKRFTPDSGPDQPLLPQYAADEDREFASRLFCATLERGEELRDLIRANCRNWEFERLAFMDIIITQIALAEILTFDSIPLNVTFNEYLDIAKMYSTPKSTAYINGLLDGIVRQLISEGRTTKRRVQRKPRGEREEKDAQ